MHTEQTGLLVDKLLIGSCYNFKFNVLIRATFYKRRLKENIEHTVSHVHLPLYDASVVDVHQPLYGAHSGRCAPTSV